MSDDPGELRRVLCDLGLDLEGMTSPELGEALDRLIACRQITGDAAFLILDLAEDSAA